MNHPLLLSMQQYGWRFCLVALLLAILWVAVAILVVWSAHGSRARFTELHAQQREYDSLLQQRAQLLVERSTVADLARIEQVAFADLDMVMPEISAVEPGR